MPKTDFYVAKRKQCIDDDDLSLFTLPLIIQRLKNE